MPTKTLLKTKMEVHTAFLMGTALVCGIIVAGAFGVQAMNALVRSTSPALKVYLSLYDPPKAIAGVRDHTFNALVLDASSLVNQIAVKEINFTVATNQANPAEVSNFRLFDGSIQLATVNDPDQDTSNRTIDGQSAIITFTLAQPLIVSKDFPKVLYVKGDVSSSALNGSYQVGIKQLPKNLKKEVVAAFFVNVNKPLKINYQFDAGPITIFISSGRLAVTIDPATQAGGLMPPNAPMWPLATFRFVASEEDMMVEKIYLTAEQVNNGGWDQISKVYLQYLDQYGQNSITMSVVPAVRDGVDQKVLFDLIDNPIYIPKNGVFLLRVLGDTANLVPSGLGEPGQGLIIKINGSDVRALGVLSARIISVEASNARGNAQYFAPN